VTMVEGPVSFVIFRDQPGSEDVEREAATPARDHSIEFFRARELAERAAAKRATSLRARWVHQELAQHYARRAARSARPERAVTPQ